MEKIEYRTERKNSWNDKDYININNNNTGENKHSAVEEKNNPFAVARPFDVSEGGDGARDGMVPIEAAIGRDNVSSVGSGKKVAEDGSNEDAEETCAIPSAPSSNRTSVNNSTDNLSYSSDNFYVDVDEIILLQNPASDDDLSVNSDDCVYAYRGGADFELAVEPRNNIAEDETDFLEMDFDPDPSSEMYPSNEILLQSNHFPKSSFLNEMDDDDRQKMFISPIEDNEETHFKCSNTVPKDTDELHFKYLNMVPKSVEVEIEPIAKDKSPSLSPKPTKVTGAKPKKITLITHQLSSAKSRKSRQADEVVPASSLSSLVSDRSTSKLESDETCLDCLEKEFVAKTIGTLNDPIECLKCRAKKKHIPYRTSISSNNIEDMTSILRSPKSSLSFDFNELMPSTSVTDAPTSCQYENQSYHSSTAQSHKSFQRRLSCDNLNCHEEQILLKRTEKEISKIPSRNIDEKTLVQALERLDIAYNADIIQSYFLHFQSSFNGITEFILYESKRDCNYKKLMKVIKEACDHRVEVKFEIDPNSVDNDFVEVGVFDILQQWKRSDDLDRLKRINRIFVQSNVLGKVVNVIRQSQQRNNSKIMDELIRIPQYYKSGYISIAKLS